MKINLIILLLLAGNLVSGQTNIAVSQLPNLTVDSVRSTDFSPIVHNGKYYKMHLGTLDSSLSLSSGIQAVLERNDTVNASDNGSAINTFNAGVGLLMNDIYWPNSGDSSELYISYFESAQPFSEYVHIYNGQQLQSTYWFPLISGEDAGFDLSINRNDTAGLHSQNCNLYLGTDRGFNLNGSGDSSFNYTFPMSNGKSGQCLMTGGGSQTYWGYASTNVAGKVNDIQFNGGNAPFNASDAFRVDGSFANKFILRIGDSIAPNAGYLTIWDGSTSGARTTISMQSGGSSHLNFSLPNGYGNAGNFLTADNAGHLGYSNAAGSSLSYSSGNLYLTDGGSNTAFVAYPSGGVDIGGNIGGGGVCASISNGQLQLGNASSYSGNLKLYNAVSGKYTGFKSSPSASSSFDLTLPPNTGSANQFLQTNGSGTLSWASAATVAGSDGQIPVNNSGVYTGYSSLIFNKSNAFPILSSLGTNGHSGQVTTGNIVLQSTSSANFTLGAYPSMSSSWSWDFPQTDGSLTYVLATTGSGLGYWQDPLLYSNKALLNAQTTAISNVVSTGGPIADHTFTIGGYVTITSVATDVLNFEVTYTDESNATRTLIMTPMSASSPNMGSTGQYCFPETPIRVKASSTVTVKTVLQTGGGSITYNVSGFIKDANY